MSAEKDNLKKQIYDVLSDVLKKKIDTQVYGVETRLEALGLHSMNFVKLGVLLEEEFDIRFTLVELKFEEGRYETIASLIQAVETKLEAAQKDAGNHDE